MANGKQLTESDKCKILTLHKEKFSTRDIARIVKYSQSAVVKFLKKYAQTGQISRKKGTGPQRKTTIREDQVIKRISLKNRFKTAVHIKSEIENYNEIKISVETVRRRLRENNLKGRKPAKKPFLNKKMKLARLQWAKKHENWDKNDWRNVIYSDESKFCLFGSDGMTYVRRRPGERLSDECIRPTVKHPAGQMIWGAFSYYGLSKLVFINGTVNAKKYIDILEENLLPFSQMHVRMAGSLIFQDDSAPCHRAKIVSIFF